VTQRGSRPWRRRASWADGWRRLGAVGGGWSWFVAGCCPRTTPNNPVKPKYTHTPPVVERADLGAPQVELARVAPPLVQRHLPEVPGLAVKVYSRPVDAVAVGGEGVEGGADREPGGGHVVGSQLGVGWDGGAVAG
jgi:hypothetical protein